MIAMDTSPAFSAEAALVAEAEDKVVQQFRRANIFGLDSVRSELCGVWESCRIPEWDGPGSSPVTQGTLLNARALVESLPLGTPLPSIGAEPDGQITLEWYRSPRNVLSVSVTDNGVLHYAGLFGLNREWGTEAFFREVPSKILGLIQRVGIL